MAAKKGSTPSDIKWIAKNRKARFNFEILETFETGMVLQGTEVKSLRAGRCNLGDSYADVVNEEVFLRNLHISPYEQAARFQHDPMRPRKLLLHRKEIRRLIGKTAEKGLTLVALSLYFKKGRAKCELGLARGKKLHDKRHAQAEKDAENKMRQAMRSGVRRRGDD